MQVTRSAGIPLVWNFLFLFSLVIAGCNNEIVKPLVNDTLTSGTIHISVDESFKPVIDQQIAVFKSSYPGSNIIAHYKPEAECLKDILHDSLTRMVLVSRGLKRNEERYLADSIGYTPHWEELATDAIAVLVNSRSLDTVFSLKQLEQMLSGQVKNKQVVFDGLSATSTVRFAIDTILKGKPFDTSVVRAVKSSSEVLQYIAGNDNAIGFVGISWIGNPEDTAQVNMLNKVKLAYIKCDNCIDSPYVQPTQYSIMTRRYPLVRGLYYILKENYSGLGSGFLNFMQYERGQLIFKRSYLGPSKIGFGLRSVQINEKMIKD